jgi:hypothetical protein
VTLLLLLLLHVAAGALMTISGVLGVVDTNPFVILQNAYLAGIGFMVIGGEIRIEGVLNNATFLRSFMLKGLFFIYISLPLVRDGWDKYRHCILFWEKGPCPSSDTPDDPDDPAPESEPAATPSTTSM